MSNRAALFAVVVAFLVGLIGALSLRSGEGLAKTEELNSLIQRERLEWRMASAWGTNLPILGEASVELVDNLRTATAGAIDINVYEPGELVPALAISESVGTGKIQAGFTWMGYDQGRIPASSLIGAVPFGMEPTAFAAWWYHGGGKALGEALYVNHGVHPILCGLIGPETAGWFRAPIESLEDFQGLKIRFAGLGGKVLQKAGASVTVLPGGEIFQALEKGAIDATEFSMPVIDEMLGFDRVSKINYFPGWHQTFTAAHMIINLELWRSLGEDSQRQLELACSNNVINMVAKAEALQGPVMQGFEAKGVSARTLSAELLQGLKTLTEEVLEEEAAANPDFARVLRSQQEFRKSHQIWLDKAYLPRGL